MDEKKRDTAVMGAEFVDLPMIPLRGLSVFPNMVLHFDIGREKSINALEKAMINNQYIFLASQMDENLDLPTPRTSITLGQYAKSSKCSSCGDSIKSWLNFRGFRNTV